MTELTLEQYWTFHTQVYIEVAKQTGAKLWLRKMMWQDPEDDVYFLSIIPIAKENKKEIDICEVTSIEDVMKNKILPLLLNNFSYNFNGYVDRENGNDKYIEVALKNGSVEEIFYFLNNVAHIKLKNRKIESFTSLQFENLSKLMSRHIKGVEILREFLIYKKIDEEDLMTQLKIKKEIHAYFREKCSSFDDLFKNLDNHQNFIDSLANAKLFFCGVEEISIWLSLMENKIPAIKFMNEYFKKININHLDNYIQVKVRDMLIEYYPNHLKIFDWINIMKEKKEEIFPEYPIKQFMPLVIDIHELQKNYPFKDIKTALYSSMLHILRDVFIEYEQFKIKNIHCNWEISNEIHREIWIVNSYPEACFTKKQLEQYIVDMIDLFMRDIINEPTINLLGINGEEKEKLKESCKKWFHAYLLSSKLNDELIDKSVIKQVKL